MESYIEYLVLSACGFYIYARLLNLKGSPKRIVSDLVFASVLALFTYSVRLFCPLVTIPAVIVLAVIYITFATKTEPGLSITTTIISFGISFTLFSFSCLLIAVVFRFINIAYTEVNGKISIACALFIQLLLSGIPFRFKRLKSGMPFLRSKGGGNSGVIFSAVLLCCLFTIRNVGNSESIYLKILSVFIFMGGAGIFVWWRGRLQKTYFERLRIKEIQDLRKSMCEKDEQIRQFRHDNDALAKIIHKDNKLIPALELAVRGFLESFDQEPGADIRLTGQRLLEQLKEVADERSGILTDYQSANKNLPQTGVFPIDALMAYMFDKARKSNVDFDFTISGSMKYLVENIIAVSDLRTLLADLIENAIIASKDCDKRKVLVSSGVFEGYYTIDIFDSGVPFELETLINFGRKKTTTHANAGGSGIGLMTVSEILNSYHTSFVIEEFSESDAAFSKKVSVKFDNLNQYAVKSKDLDKAVICNASLANRSASIAILHGSR
jgi:Histidine kinase-, DNA gyrase B-, and HSP90-like ATPase.